MGYVQVKPGEKFLEVLRELSSIPSAPDNVKAFSERRKKEDIETLLLKTSDVKWCHNKIKERGLPHRIHLLLNESEIILPKYEPPPRNPELEARVQRLKTEEANREYRRMTQGLNGKTSDVMSLNEVGKDLREMNRQLVTGAQYLLSVIGTFFAVFIGLNIVTMDYGSRILIAVFSSLVVGIAEIYFIIKEDLYGEKKIK